MKPRFGTVAALSKVKRFCPRRFERFPIKNASFVICTAADLYLARARARARAGPSCKHWGLLALLTEMATIRPDWRARVFFVVHARAAVVCDWM